MKRKFVKVILLSLPFFLGGCSTWDEFVAIVNSGWSTISCWFLSLVSAALQQHMNWMAATVAAIASILPTVSLPTISLDSTFMSAIAFFVPVSEMATVVVTVLGAVTLGYAAIVILRWLKIVR